MRRLFSRLAAAAALLPVLVFPALAQDWPAGKTVQIVVPAPGGGGTGDSIARVVSEALAKRLQTSVVIDNKPGANGNIGASAAATAAPDGHHLLFSWAGTLAVNPSLYRNLSYDPQKDFVPIVLIGGVPNVLVVNNDLPAKDLAAFTDFVRKNPGRLNYASSGNGSSMHLAAELYKQQTGTFMVHVPYNSVGQATIDLMANQIQVMFHLITGAQGAIAQGQIKPIAVLANERSSALPAVPTMKELGMPIESQTWFALLFPRGAPPEAVQKLNEATNRILADPVARKRLIAMGLEPAGGSPQDLSRHLDAEISKWAAVVKYSGAKID